MRHPTVTLLIALAFALNLATGAVASTSEAQWTPAIARQLVSPGWEAPPTPGEQRVIVYSLWFVQLKSEASRAYEFALGAASGTDGGDSWTIELDEETMHFVNSLGLTSQFDARSVHTASHSGMVQESWLTTVEHEPVRLAVREESIWLNGRTTEELTITLKPERVDSQAHRILTHFVFDSISHGGVQSQAETTLWTDYTQPQPVAVVTQRVHGAYQQTDRQFAIYVQGKVVPPDRVPSELDVLPVGNVRAIQLFFPQTESKWKLPHFGLAFAINTRQDGGHFETQMFHRTGQSHLLHARMSGKASDPLRYSVGFHLNLVEQLALVTRVDRNQPGTTGLAFRLGFTERTRLGPMLEASATVLPVAYIPGTGLTTRGSRIAGAVRYSRQQWDIFLEADYMGQLHSTVGMGVYPTHEYGLEFRWTHVPGEPYSWSVRALTLRW